MGENFARIDDLNKTDTIRFAWWRRVECTPCRVSKCFSKFWLKLRAKTCSCNSSNSRKWPLTSLGPNQPYLLAYIGPLCTHAQLCTLNMSLKVMLARRTELYFSDPSPVLYGSLSHGIVALLIV